LSRVFENIFPKTEYFLKKLSLFFDQITFKFLFEKQIQFSDPKNFLKSFFDFFEYTTFFLLKFML